MLHTESVTENRLKYSHTQCRPVIVTRWILPMTERTTTNRCTAIERSVTETVRQEWSIQWNNDWRIRAKMSDWPTQRPACRQQTRTTHTSLYRASDGLPLIPAVTEYTIAPSCTCSWETMSTKHEAQTTASVCRHAEISVALTRLQRSAARKVGTLDWYFSIKHEIRLLP